MAKHIHDSHLSGNVIRARQRTQTALFPHSHNVKFLVPKRKQGPIIKEHIFKTIQTTVEFFIPVSGGTGAGYTLFNNTTGLFVVVNDAINGTPQQILIQHAVTTIGDKLTLTYKPSGWTSAVGAVNGYILVGDVT